jgi:hypothetical protein
VKRVVSAVAAANIQKPARLVMGQSPGEKAWLVNTKV